MTQSIPTVREAAMKWWSALNTAERQFVTDEYGRKTGDMSLDHIHANDLTSKQIETIYLIQ